MLQACEAAAALLLLLRLKTYNYGEFNPVISMPYYIHNSIWWKGSTKTGKVSAAQVLSQVVSQLRYV